MSEGTKVTKEELILVLGFGPEEMEEEAASFDEVAREEYALLLDVEAGAKAPGSSIHECFEWDDKRAARLWRLCQARALRDSMPEEEE
ncbi:MAG: hypothetical protein GY941_02630 [Planctomycetes bacterium]|nr:hypothetical protein [Planctomycetota bacterium]